MDFAAFAFVHFCIGFAVGFVGYFFLRHFFRS